MEVDKRKKTGGRVKGTPNKLNADAKKLFVETLGKHSENIDEALETVFKEDKVKFLELFAKYAMYFTPKMTENSNKVDITSSDFNIKDVLKFDKPKS